MISITEEQKKVIESQGFMVVEFKLWCKKLTYAVHRIRDTWSAIIVFLKDKIFKAVESIGLFAERMVTKLGTFIDQQWDADGIEKPKFQFIRVLGTKYRCDYARVTIYHCRNNC